ncbi:Lipase, class 3 [Corchorus olitorius]|uniref:Lipase, class 3 n=1 Tax=Corchorus olitorius TaxID=93759 RepID=A0A1R3K4J7_9ROSI|nr:Lipase, class 3 [Corchorus olitorius]
MGTEAPAPGSMECDKGFSCNYMLLKPEEVKFVDLFHILCSSSLEDRKFVDSSAETAESFRHRWLIFISIVAQKFLMFTCKPMSWMGSVIETWLNLLELNSNFFVLIWNFVRGKAVMPDKDSEKFISFIGNLDKRKMLDSNIKPGDGCRYYSALSMMASKASYENRAYIETIVKDHWKMEYLGFYDYWNDYQEKATTQLFYLRDKTDDHDTIVVAIRGTEPFDADAWCSDFDLSWYELPNMGKIHGGFMKALGLQKNVGWPRECQDNGCRKEPLAYYDIRDKLKALLSESEKTKFILTGHSQGGALAILFPAILFLHEEKFLLERLEGIYTYGQPRVGDELFGKYMESKLEEHKIGYYRVVYGNDIVPRLPYDDKDLLFKHFGTCVYYNRHYQGKVILQIVPEEPNKNYFSAISAVPMMANAVSHSTQDYVNSTRLGSLDAFTLPVPQESHNFSGNYLVLRPNELTIFDLFRLLWSHDLEKKAFVECPPETFQENIRRKWLIFMSLSSQKFLLNAATPLNWLGEKLEMWVNLVSFNCNIFVLLLNFLRGKVIIPDRESENFRSLLGNLDRRIELDKNIKPGDCKYYGALAAMAAKLSYENRAFVERIVRDYWKMELIGYYNFWNDYQKKSNTQAIMVHDKSTNMIIVAFRGTEPFNADDWSTDLDLSWYELDEMGKIHGGFMKALGLVMEKGWPLEVEQDENRPLAYYTIREKLRQQLQQNKEANFMVTGHSLGGALSILFPAVLALHEEKWLLDRLEGVYTFGQPRVGDKKFKEFMEIQLQNHDFRYLRYVYCNDIIPRTPTDDITFLYKHFGTCLYFNSCYKGKILEEEPNKNYISLIAWIPRSLNAIWELARGFILPLMKGPDYKESWLLVLLRILGLAFPGLSAHNPQEYVNVTRLCSPRIYHQLEDDQHPTNGLYLAISKANMIQLQQKATILVNSKGKIFHGKLQ